MVMFQNQSKIYINQITYTHTSHGMMLSTHSHDPWQLGESDVPVCGSPTSFSVHLASSAVTPAGSVPKSRGDNVGAVEEMMCVVLQKGHSGDGCVLASTLCKYDLRKDDLFVLSWARVRRVKRGSPSTELLMCGGGVHSILLLPLVARCLETIDGCIWRMFVFYVCCSNCVGICGNVCCVAAVVKNSLFLALEC